MGDCGSGGGMGGGKGAAEDRRGEGGRLSHCGEWWRELTRISPRAQWKERFNGGSNSLDF